MLGGLIAIPFLYLDKDNHFPTKNNAVSNVFFEIVPEWYKVKAVRVITGIVVPLNVRRIASEWLTHYCPLGLGKHMLPNNNQMVKS